MSSESNLRESGEDFEWMHQRIKELEELTGELRREIDTLEASADRFRILFEFAPDAYYLSDLQGVFIE